MKKYFCFLVFSVVLLPARSQSDRSSVLENLESNNQQQRKDMTATVKSAARLFGSENDLTSVIQIIPSGSQVTVLGADSAYLRVAYDSTEGYILKRKAVIDQGSGEISREQVQNDNQLENQNAVNQNQNDDSQQMSRFSYLEEKYGTSMAARLSAGKIWKGMSAEMVKDSWGSPREINRVINGNTVREEWVFRNTWLYMENNRLVDWGPVRR